MSKEQGTDEQGSDHFRSIARLFLAHLLPGLFLFPAFSFFGKAVIKQAFHAAVVAAGAGFPHGDLVSIECEIDHAGIALRGVLRGIVAAHGHFSF